MRTDPLHLRGLFLVNPSEIIGKVIETELKNNLKKYYHTSMLMW